MERFARPLTDSEAVLLAAVVLAGTLGFVMLSSTLGTAGYAACIGLGWLLRMTHEWEGLRGG